MPARAEANTLAHFQLLHITDLHIAIPPEDNHLFQRTLWQSREYVYPSCANRYALQALAEFVSHQRDDVDLILLTGDLADNGLKRNLEAAFRFVTTPATDDWFIRPFEPTIDAKRVDGPPILIMPGNHDRFDGPARLPGGILFDSIFSDYWHSGLGGVQSVLLPHDNPRLALISSDFCLQNVRSAAVYLGQGRAYLKIVNDLVEKTEMVRAANPDIGIIWVTHFPPLLNLDYELKLLRPERLLTAARANGVRQIIAGHLHRNQINHYADVEVICTGSASSVSAGEIRGNWIFRFDVEVEADGIVSIEKTGFQYRPEDGIFA